MDDKELFFLSEKIRFDKFNEKVEKEFQERYKVDNRINEYFSTDSTNSYSIGEERKRKSYLFKFVSPLIDLSRRFYATVQLIYEPKLYHFSFFLMTLWAYKNIKCINKLLHYKYNDIFYQVIRPDSLSSRNKAFKILVLGGLTIPVSSLTFVLYDMNKTKKNSFLKNTFDTTNAISEKKKNPFIPYTLRRRIANNIYNFKDKIFITAKDFAENNNFKKLSTEYHKNIDQRIKGLSVKK